MRCRTPIQLDPPVHIEHPWNGPKYVISIPTKPWFRFVVFHMNGGRGYSAVLFFQEGESNLPRTALRKTSSDGGYYDGKPSGKRSNWKSPYIDGGFNRRKFKVKLPTIWTDEKQRLEESEREEQKRDKQKRKEQSRERVRRRKMQVREKVGKSRNTAFF